MHIEFIKGGRLRRALVAGFAMASVGLAAAGPLTAHASDIDNCGPNFAMTCAGTVQSVSINGATATAVASCTASTGDNFIGVATGVECSIVGETDHVTYGVSVRWLPGPASTTVFDASVPAGQRYEVCIEAGVVTPSAALDVQNPVCGLTFL